MLRADSTILDGVEVCENTSCKKRYADVEPEYETKLLQEYVDAERDAVAARVSSAGPSSTFSVKDAAAYKTLGLANKSLPAVMAHVHKAYDEDQVTWADNELVLGKENAQGLLEDAARKLEVKYDATSINKTTFLNQFRNTLTAGGKTAKEIIENLARELA